MDDLPERREMFRRTTQAGYEVFNKKGYTNYAIAMAGSYVIEAIASDTRHTMPLSVLIDGDEKTGGYAGVSGVCLSVPVVVGREGIIRWMRPELTDEESQAFSLSADVIRQTIVATLADEERQ